MVKKPKVEIEDIPIAADIARGDQVLKKMLQTKPKPHKDIATKTFIAVKPYFLLQSLELSTATQGAAQDESPINTHLSLVLPLNGHPLTKAVTICGQIRLRNLTMPALV